MDKLNIIAGYKPSSIGEAIAVQTELEAYFDITSEIKVTQSNFNLTWYVVKEKRADIIGPPIHRLVVSSLSSEHVYKNLETFIRIVADLVAKTSTIDKPVEAICRDIRMAHHEYVESKGRMFEPSARLIVRSNGTTTFNSNPYSGYSSTTTTYPVTTCFYKPIDWKNISSNLESTYPVTTGNANLSSQSDDDIIILNYLSKN
jgi:hypothetical protein